MSTQTTSHQHSASSAPPNQQAAPAPPAYSPLPSPVDWADMQSRQLTNLAAGKGADELGLKGPEGEPAEFPKALYNKKTRETKAAKDKDEEDKLSGQGFSTEPLPPEDPVALTPDEVKTLESLLAKAAKALEKLGQASQDNSGKAPATQPAAPPKK